VPIEDLTSWEHSNSLVMNHKLLFGKITRMYIIREMSLTVQRLTFLCTIKYFLLYNPSVLIYYWMQYTPAV